MPDIPTLLSIGIPFGSTIVFVVVWFIRLEGQVKRQNDKIVGLEEIPGEVENIKIRLHSMEQTMNVWRTMFSPESVKAHHVELTEIKKDIEALQAHFKHLMDKKNGA